MNERFQTKNSAKAKLKLWDFNARKLHLYGTSIKLKQQTKKPFRISWMCSYQQIGQKKANMHIYIFINHFKIKAYQANTAFFILDCKFQLEKRNISKLFLLLKYHYYFIELGSLEKTSLNGSLYFRN